MDLPKPLGGRRILVVEDDFLVAEVVADILTDAGAEVVGPIGCMEEALSFVEHSDQSFDGAFLDINLHGIKSYPIADALAARHVAFVFATGYGADVIDPAYLRYPRCEKPFKNESLVAAFARF